MDNNPAHNATVDKQRKTGHVAGALGKRHRVKCYPVRLPFDFLPIYLQDLVSKLAHVLHQGSREYQRIQVAVLVKILELQVPSHWDAVHIALVHSCKIGKNSASTTLMILQRWEHLFVWNKACALMSRSPKKHTRMRMMKDTFGCPLQQIKQF